jgi:hypothetical protein
LKKLLILGLLIRNRKVVGLNPMNGSTKFKLRELHLIYAAYSFKF